ncbi:hypothetical protein [Streptomyces niveus]|uniref:hypothetical protein n=1 Tax=Streptomyces niveus TaxID=193462 RepID=UPI00114D2799|nr:hypothetical protein [Streptomyces niveus]
MPRTRRRLMGYCAACARPVRLGDYLMCSKGCGGRLCRSHGRCIARHSPNCPQRATAYTDSPQEAA